MSITKDIKKFKQEILSTFPLYENIYYENDIKIIQDTILEYNNTNNKNILCNDCLNVPLVGTFFRYLVISINNNEKGKEYIFCQDCCIAEAL